MMFVFRVGIMVVGDNLTDRCDHSPFPGLLMPFPPVLSRRIYSIWILRFKEWPGNIQLIYPRNISEKDLCPCGTFIGKGKSKKERFLVRTSG